MAVYKKKMQSVFKGPFMEGARCISEWWLCGLKSVTPNFTACCLGQRFLESACCKNAQTPILGIFRRRPNGGTNMNGCVYARRASFVYCFMTPFRRTQCSTINFCFPSPILQQLVTFGGTLQEFNFRVNKSHPKKSFRKGPLF
jgi:hypothetical protein